MLTLKVIERSDGRITCPVIAETKQPKLVEFQGKLWFFCGTDGKGNWVWKPSLRSEGCIEALAML